MPKKMNRHWGGEKDGGVKWGFLFAYFVFDFLLVFFCLFAFKFLFLFYFYYFFESFLLGAHYNGKGWIGKDWEMSGTGVHDVKFPKN